MSADGTATIASGDTLDIASGASFEIASVKVTSAAAELNYVDITTLGSSQNSKALTVSADGTATVVSGDTLDIASGASFEIAGTKVTSSAAELNILTGVTAAATELNYVDITTL